MDNTWSAELAKVGLYYEGFVDDLEEILESHRRCTQTSYGTRHSKKSTCETVISDKENEDNSTETEVRKLVKITKSYLLGCIIILFYYIILFCKGNEVSIILEA